MSNILDYGSGPGRTIQVSDRALDGVIFQKQKPVLSADLNLIGEIQAEARAQILRSSVPSGFLNNGINPEKDFQFDPSWSNFFMLGRQSNVNVQQPVKAVVNGWLVNVVGTNLPALSLTRDDLRNKINMEGVGTTPRTDFVFLEVFLARLPANATSLTVGSRNIQTKPATTKLYKYGNRNFGGTNPDDEMIDPQVGVEIAQRTQLQYRIRVVKDVDVIQAPEGFDTNLFYGGFTKGKVKAWGAGLTNASSPSDVTANDGNGWDFISMAEELGDSGLWRAGDGSSLAKEELGTVDGYVYAVPICAVRRRHRSGFVNGLSGGLDRQIAAGGTSSVPTVLADPYEFASGRPDGLYADQVSEVDIIDLRHSVTLAGWNYDTLLDTNTYKLLQGTLRSTPKAHQADVGTVLNYADEISISSAPIPSTTENGVNPIAAFNGMRRWFSDVPLPELDLFTVMNTQGGAIGANQVFSIEPIGLPAGYKFLTTKLKVELENRDDLVVQYSTAISAGLGGDKLDITITGIYLKDQTTKAATGSALTGFKDRIWVTYSIMLPPNTGLTRRPDKIDKIVFTPLSGEGGDVLTPNTSGIPAGVREITPTYIQFNKDICESKQADADGVAANAYLGKELRYGESYFDLGSKTVALTPWKAQVLEDGVSFQTVASVNTRVPDYDVLLPTSGIQWNATLPDAFSVTGLIDNFSDRSIFLNVPGALSMKWGRQDMPIIATGGNFGAGLHGVLTPTGVINPQRTDPDNTGRFVAFLYTPTAGVNPAAKRIKFGENTTKSIGAVSTVVSWNSVGIRANPTKAGLEFPPYFGISRVRGVYEYNDIANSPVLGFDLANITNRLKFNNGTNPTTRSLWIGEYKKDGVTTYANTPTFTVLADAIDGYDPNKGYVVVADFFAYGDGFLQNNWRVYPDASFNYSSANRRVVDAYMVNGDHLTKLTPNNSSADDPTKLTTIKVVTNRQGLAAGGSAKIHFTRTVYQGDVFNDDMWPAAATDAGSYNNGYEPAVMDFRGIKPGTVSPALLNANLRVFNVEFAEILAHNYAVTTLGTGRFSGHPITNFMGFYTGASIAEVNAMGTAYKGPIGQTLEQVPTQLAGLTTRLPMGWNLRDYEFTGEVMSGRALHIQESHNVVSSDIVDVKDDGSSFEQAGSPSGDWVATTKGSQHFGQGLVFRSLRGGSGLLDSGAPVSLQLDESASYAGNRYAVLNLLVRSKQTYRTEVRNIDTANDNPLNLIHPGDELQIISIAGLAKNIKRFLTSPVGLGEGLVSVTRYRLAGRPLDKSQNNYLPDFPSEVAGARGSVVLDIESLTPVITDTMQSPQNLDLTGENFLTNFGDSVVTFVSPTAVVASVTQAEIEGKVGGVFGATGIVIPNSLMATAVSFTTTQLGNPGIVPAGTMVYVTADGVDSAAVEVEVNLN